MEVSTDYLRITWIRFGCLGSDPFYQYPDIKITNRQSVPPHKIQDEHYPHLQNINADGSSIFITSGPARVIDSLIPACVTLTTPDVLDGDMITLNSDRLVFNSKNTDTIERIREQVIKKFMDKASIIYKEDSSEDYFIVCKKQTCSPKLKNLEELENYFKNL